MSGHLDGPPPGPPDPPYIPGDLGAPSAEEFARRRGQAATFDPRHPHEPEIPPAPDEEAIRCDERERLSARVYENGWCPTCAAPAAASPADQRLREAPRETVARALWEFDGYMEPWHESERALYFEKADAVLAALAGAAASPADDCSRCRGDGMLPGDNGNVPCEACQGTGRSGRPAASPVDERQEWACCGRTFTGTPDFISGARSAHICPPEDVPDAETAYAMGRAAASAALADERLREAAQLALDHLDSYLRGESGLAFVEPYPAARNAATVLVAALGAGGGSRVTIPAPDEPCRAHDIWPCPECHRQPTRDPAIYFQGVKAPAGGNGVDTPPPNPSPDEPTRYARRGFGIASGAPPVMSNMRAPEPEGDNPAIAPPSNPYPFHEPLRVEHHSDEDKRQAWDEGYAAGVVAGRSIPSTGTGWDRGYAAGLAAIDVDRAAREMYDRWFAGDDWDGEAEVRAQLTAALRESLLAARDTNEPKEKP